ncbi:hypothetical protein ABL78_1325 [Leptomonas seymouri]|uniref:Thioesterase domain-containing protein n=1 Tax=Leptomonas seymouri TaxID=5684 RepID=A0A0N0P8I2_LEPSE|nr:hypothetical protein ABL78_1325 [Leptomonas seymouri]|eukprot:KPI89557.1 hypothetical protein ABL78_1325 [Leptomonas seymouri]
MSDILSSPCWVKATDYANPSFRNAYDNYVDVKDVFGGHLMRQMLKISADDFLVASVPCDEMSVYSPTVAATRAEPTAEASMADGHHPALPSDFPYVVAAPFTVCPEVCDSSDTADAHQPRYMVESAATALMDMVTSFHIIMAKFPKTNGHVSLSIQTNHMDKMVCGKTYLVISRIDKMGRRIVYTSVDFVEPQLQRVHDAQADPLPISNTTELLSALKSATVLANVKHVKSMLSSS